MKVGVFVVRQTCMDWCKYIFGKGVFDDAVDIISLNPSVEPYDTAWGVVTTLYENVCVPIAMGLVLIYFMVNLLEKSTQQQTLDLEQVIKLFLKLFVGLFFIEHGLELMCSIYSLGFAFLDSISDVTTKTPEGTEIYKSMWTNLTGEPWDNSKWGTFEGIGKFIGVGLQLLIPYLVTVALKIFINFVCFTRLVEFYIKTATAPIALSDFFTEGIHGNGWKFIKGYIAIALQGGVIMLSIVFFNSLSSAFLDNGAGYWTFLVKYLALAFTTVGIMLKSLSLTKEIVGAN